MHKLLVAATLLAFMARADAEPSHIVFDGKTTFGPTTSVAFDKDLESGAREFQKQHPQGADRFVAYDMAGPLDAAEYQAMGKHAVLLIAAFTHDSTELPIYRVYVRTGGREIALKRILAVRRQLQDKSVALTVYGQYREDAFYLMPISLIEPGAELICDFTAHRTGFVLGNLELPPVDFITADKNRIASSEPLDAALRAFFKREYPGIVP